MKENWLPPSPPLLLILHPSMIGRNDDECCRWFSQLTVVLLWTILFSENVITVIQNVHEMTDFVLHQHKVKNTFHKEAKVLNLHLCPTISVALEVCCSTSRIMVLKLELHIAPVIVGMDCTVFTPEWSSIRSPQILVADWKYHPFPSKPCPGGYGIPCSVSATLLCH